jgi:hypothetical protein
MSELTAERLREILDYYPQTGIWVWRVGRRAGREAGCKLDSGYVLIRIDGRLYRANRLAWLYMTGEWPPEDIDHEDRNPANGSFFNLRPATRGENIANAKRARNNTPGYKGVGWDHRVGKWRAKIVVDGRQIYLGWFDTVEAAAAAYAAGAQYHWGEYGRP